MIAQPLPASSRALRDRRYHVDVADRNERGTFTVFAEGRFTSFEDAKVWADETYPDAPLVNVAFLSARTGWRRDAAGQRRDGEWGR